MTPHDEIPIAPVPAGDELDARIDSSLRSLFAPPRPEQLEALFPVAPSQEPWRENHGQAPLLAVAGVLLAVGAAFGLQGLMPRFAMRPASLVDPVADASDPRAWLTSLTLESMERVARTGEDLGSCLALESITPLPGTSAETGPLMSCNVHPGVVAGPEPLILDPLLGSSFPWPASLSPGASFEVLRELRWERWPEARIAAVQEGTRCSLLFAVPRDQDPGSPLPRVETTRLSCAPQGAFIYYEACIEDGDSTRTPLLTRLFPVEGAESVSNPERP